MQIIANKTIEDIINKKVLGCTENLAQWYLPSDKKSGRPKEIGTINIENYKIQKFLSAVDDIIELSISDENRKENGNAV